MCIPNISFCYFFKILINTWRKIVDIVAHDARAENGYIRSYFESIRGSWLCLLLLSWRNLLTNIKMVQVNKVEVLKDCRKYLNLINLCNEGVFIRSFRIPDILITIPLLVPISYTTGLLYYYCFANHFDFNIIAFAFSVCIGSTQIALVYLTLTIEKRVIFDTMNEIQHLVDYRKSNCWHSNRFF